MTTSRPEPSQQHITAVRGLITRLQRQLGATGPRDEWFRSARAMTWCSWWRRVTREAGLPEVVMSPSGTTLPLRINP
jgi:hypothetical protein